METKEEMANNVNNTTTKSEYCKGFVCAFLRQDITDRCQATNMKCERERCDCYGSCCVCMRNEDNEDLKESLK